MKKTFNMTRKGFIALLTLPFFGQRKATPPPVAKALADAGIAAIKAMQQKVTLNRQFYLKGEDIIAAFDRTKGGNN